MPRNKKSASLKKKNSKPSHRFSFSPSLKNQLLLLVSLVFLLVGITFISTYVDLKFPRASLSFISQGKKPTLGNQTGPIEVSPSLLKDNGGTLPPERIVIPSSNIDLNVIEAPVVDGYWATSDTTASHGIGSANPGQKGNAVIFAHARVGLFYNLKDVKENDVVYVLTQSKWYAYKVEKITSVFPNQVEVIAPTKDETLTLYTCTGYADEKRLIVVAKPIKS